MSPPRRDRRTAILIVVLAIPGALLLAAWATLARRCSRALHRAADGLDALRTDRTWRDTYREMTPQDATAFRASFEGLADPALHPRMGRGAVVRGRIRTVHPEAHEEPCLTLHAGSGTVDCRFDPRRRERLAALAPEQEVVIGGALVDCVKGNPVLVACHFADEWEKD